MPDEVKGTVFREKRMAYNDQITNSIFWLFLKSVLCVYGEYDKQRKKPEKCPLILDQTQKF
jgi:hypothetical protein